MSAASARRVSRDSERRRRALGKAETPEHQRARYAANPEPQRAACRAYYAAHREQVGASVRAYYQASRAVILAAKRTAYAARRAAELRAAPGRACGPVVYPNEPSYPLGWPAESDAAVRLCLHYCPVLTQCRRWALAASPDQPGVIAGLTQAQRAAR